MRRSLILASFTCLFLLLSPPAGAQLTNEELLAQDGQEVRAWIGKPFPAFSFSGCLGRQYTNKDFEGKVTLVDVWKLGCTPCVFSIKYLNAIHDSMKRSGFQLLSMIKDDWAACQTFMHGDGKLPGWDSAFVRRNYTLPQYEIISMGSARKTAQNRIAANQLNSTGWPLFIVVDGKGIIRDVQSGFEFGNDVHAERPAKAPFENPSIKWMMAALNRAQTHTSTP